MKSTFFTQITTVLVVGSLLAACSAATPDKKAELEKLKADQGKLSEQIKKLESELNLGQANADPVNAKEVVTTTLKPRVFNHYVETHGSLESIENIQVSAKTAGIITEVYVVEGQMVSKGQVMGQVDNSLILRSIEELKSSLEMAKTVFERQKNLWDQKIGRASCRERVLTGV